MTNQTNQPITKLLTISQFCEEHKFASQGGLRHLVFNASNNGMRKANVIKKLGRRVLIDENAFFSWVNETDGGNNV
jgi:hypothetical protein